MNGCGGGPTTAQGDHDRSSSSHHNVLHSNPNLLPPVLPRPPPRVVGTTGDGVAVENLLEQQCLSSWDSLPLFSQQPRMMQPPTPPKTTTTWTMTTIAEHPTEGSSRCYSGDGGDDDRINPNNKDKQEEPRRMPLLEFSTPQGALYSRMDKNNKHNTTSTTTTSNDGTDLVESTNDPYHHLLWQQQQQEQRQDEQGTQQLQQQQQHT